MSLGINGSEILGSSWHPTLPNSGKLLVSLSILWFPNSWKLLVSLGILRLQNSWKLMVSLTIARFPNSSKRWLQLGVVRFPNSWKFWWQLGLSLVLLGSSVEALVAGWCCLVPKFLKCLLQLGSTWQQFGSVGCSLVSPRSPTVRSVDGILVSPGSQILESGGCCSVALGSSLEALVAAWYRPDPKLLEVLVAAGVTQIPNS